MALDIARVKFLFLAASDLASPAERAAYLDRESGGDAELRARVEALLKAVGGPVLESDATGAFELNSPETLPSTGTTADETLAEITKAAPKTELTIGVVAPDKSLSELVTGVLLPDANQTTTKRPLCGRPAVPADLSRVR